jgi:hypothetical protein
MRRALAAGAVVLSLGLASCAGGTTGPDQSKLDAEAGEEWVRVIGTLAQCNYCMVVGGGAAAVPGTAKAGEPFSIRVSTISTNGCIKDAGTEVPVRASLARVVAYDSVPGPTGAICTGALSGMYHDATVRFAWRGDGPGRRLQGLRGGETAGFARLQGRGCPLGKKACPSGSGHNGKPSSAAGRGYFPRPFVSRPHPRQLRGSRRGSRGVRSTPSSAHPRSRPSGPINLWRSCWYGTVPIACSPLA